MSDEVSLFALMDSHLSKTKLEDKTNTACCTYGLPTPSGPRLGIPNLFPGNSPMKDFLAEQIARTLKAKEKQKKEEEEQRKIEEEMKNLRIREKEQLSTVDGMAKMNLNNEQEYIIDLTPAIIKQPKTNQSKVQPLVADKTRKAPQLKRGPSRVPSDPSLCWDNDTCLYVPWNPNLPCTTDISYILKQKIKRGKCSSFGKVLCSRVRTVPHVTIPYEINKYDSNIVRFDFKTKSPGDIFKENQRKPKMSTRWTVDILDYI